MALLVALLALFTRLPFPFAGLYAADEQVAEATARAVELVQQHCVKCHGGEETNAGVDLSDFQSDLDVWKARDKWIKVLGMLEGKLMPPEEEPALLEKDRAALIEWIGHTLEHVEVDRIPRDPGSVPPRRLNRHEYNYTVRDLFGVDVRPADGFPKDQTYGSGFDNEAVILTVESLWFEKALVAAGETVRSVWKDRGALERLLFARPTPAPVEEKAVYVASPAESANCDMGDGNFTAIARFRGTSPATVFSKSPSGSGFSRRSKDLFFNGSSIVYRIRRGRELRAQDVDVVDGRMHAVGLHVEEGRATLFLDGRLLVSLADFSRPDGEDHLFKIGKSRSLMDKTHPKFAEGFAELSFFEDALSEAKVLALTAGKDAGEIPDPVFHWHPGIEKTETDLVTAAEAATANLERFLARAFRRPPTGDEITRYLNLFQQASDSGLPFEVAMQLPIKAALASPSFLFRTEADAETSEPYPVSSIEMASRLSYFLWSSMPDDELLTAGREGVLSRPEGLLAQSERMLADERAQRFFERFSLQWLQIEGLGETIRPDPERFPGITPSLLEAMKRESVLVFADVIRDNRSLFKLLDRDTTFTNEELAAHYGFRDIRGNEFREVTTRGSDGGGLLTQASVLTVTSSPRRTSPVFRGKWVLDVLLGEPPPPPPPNVGELPADVEAEDTNIRSLLATHREQASCAACHNRIDPLGLALEQYDAVGRRRAEDRDTSATLQSGEVIDGVTDLKKMLLEKERDAYTRNLAKKLLAYALGRELTFADERPLHGIIAAVEHDQYRAGTLIREIILSDPFRNRMIPSGDTQIETTSASP